MVSILIGMYSKLTLKYREENKSSQIVNIGSCSFHVTHGVLQAGIMETDWEIHKVLHAIWKISDDSPVRRDIYKW